MSKHKRPLRLTKRGRRVRAVVILALALALIQVTPSLVAWFNNLNDLGQTQALVLGFSLMLVPYLYKITS